MSQIEIKTLSNQELENQKREIFNNFKKFEVAIFDFESGEYDVVGGAITKDPNQSKESNYERFFLGDNSIIAIWRNSRSLVLRDDFPQSDLDYCELDNNDFSTCPTFTDMNKVFTKGDTVNLYVDTKEFGVGGNNGVATTASKLIAYTENEIDVNDAYSLYVFPEIDNFFYKIVKNGIKEFRTPSGEYGYSKVEFTKITRIGDTTNLDQIIQKFSSVGEGYAWPEWNEEIKEITISQSKLKNKPVKFIQVDFEDPAAISTIYAIGRELEGGSADREVFSEPRILMPSRFYQQDGNKLIGNIAPTDLFFYSYNSRLDIQSSYKNWLDKIRSKYNDFSKKDWRGVLTDNVENTVRFSDSITSDSLIDVNVNRLYWDQLQNNIGTDVNFKAVSPFVNQETGFTIPSNQLVRYEDLMAHNIFGYSHVLTLPMHYQEFAPFSLAGVGGVTGGIVGNFGGATISLISGFLGGTIGSMIGWENEKSTSNKVGDLRLFYPSWNYTSLWNGTYGADNTTNEQNAVVPLDFLTKDRAESLFGTADSYTSIKMLLTDKYVDLGNNEFSTKDLGKEINGEIKLWSGTNRVISNDESGWAIDGIVIQAISETKVYVTFYDENNNTLQTSQFLTTSSRTGNIRNWTTIFETSSWNSNVPIVKENGNPIAPTPGEQIPDISLNLDKVVTNDLEIWEGDDGSLVSNFEFTASDDSINNYRRYSDEKVVNPGILSNTTDYLNYEIKYVDNWDLYFATNASYASGNTSKNSPRQLEIFNSSNSAGGTNTANQPSIPAKTDNSHTLDVNTVKYSKARFNTLETGSEYNSIVIKKSQFNTWIKLEDLSRNITKNYGSSQWGVENFITSGGLEYGYVDYYGAYAKHIIEDRFLLDDYNIIRQEGFTSRTFDTARPKIEIMLYEEDSSVKMKFRFMNGMFGSYKVNPDWGGTLHYYGATIVRVNPEVTIKGIRLFNNNLDYTEGTKNKVEDFNTITNKIKSLKNKLI